MNLKLSVAAPLAVLLALHTFPALAVEPAIAELSFTNWQQNAPLPNWITAVEQDGGSFASTAWVVDASLPKGVGRLAITIDRQTFKEDAALVVTADDANADLAVQLFDDQNRVIVLDLFGNILAVGDEAKTDTFIVPLRKYPTATKIVLRRITGPITVRGIILYPVVMEAYADTATLQNLAKFFGDPLSPENPLLKSPGGASANPPASNPSSTIPPADSSTDSSVSVADHGAFTASSMNTACFALVGIYQGQYRVHPDSVEVWLPRADLYVRNISTYRGRRHLQSLRAGLSTLTGKDCAWHLAIKSEPVPVDLIVQPEDRHVLKNYHFIIPRNPALDLTQYWLTFEMAENPVDDPAHNTRTGTTYAHSSHDVFQTKP